MDNSIVNYKALGAKIKDKRQQLGLTQEKVAEYLDLSESFYSRVERGERVLSVETLVKISNYYNFSIDYLLFDCTRSSCNNKILAEIENIIRDKNPSQADFLLKLLKIHAENVNYLQP